MDALVSDRHMQPAAADGAPATHGAIRLTIAAIALLLALQFALIFTRAVNWDEFFFYGQVAQFARGELPTPLQTIHVHAFQWLLALPGSTVDHILAARIPMFGFELVTLGGIYALARRFTDPLVSALAVLAYLSAGYVLQHGMSFRVDPPVTASLVVALAVLARAPLRWWSVLLTGALIGLAGMITIKAVLYAPAFLGMAWLRWAEADRDRATGLRIAAIGLAALAIFAALYLWHAAAIAASAAPLAQAASAPSPTVPDTGAQAGAVLNRSASDMFFIGVPPYWRMIVKAASLAPLFALLILTAPFAIARSGLTRAAKWALAGLWMPVLTLAFYRNSAGYFYVFLLPPLAIAASCGLDWLRSRFGALPVIAVMLTIALATWASDDRKVLASQRSVSDAAQRMFPQGTAYFDHSGMIGSFRKANGFMTPWGMEQYRRAGSYRAAMEAQTVPLLIENDIMVTAALTGGDKTAILLPEDARAWRENYVRYWGTIWLAGKSLPAGSAIDSEFLIPGRYRVEGHDVSVDGVPHEAGDIVTIARGVHVLANASKRPARLVWADIADPPQGKAPQGDLWIGY
jgi:hypothetical protein